MDADRGCARVAVLASRRFGAVVASEARFEHVTAPKTDTELKHLAGIGGARSGRSRGGSTKKRADLGSSCHVGHGSATLVVGAIERKKLRKPGLMSATEKPAQTRQDFVFRILFWSVRVFS